MKKRLVIIENDSTLKDANYVNAFMKHYDGEIIELTNFTSRTSEEIFAHVSKCTDIAVQTCFVNGSDQQLFSMVKLLSKIEHTINIYIAYLGLRNNNELFDYLSENLTPTALISIEQHKIFSLRNTSESLKDEESPMFLDFSKITLKEHKRLNDIIEYKQTAPNRPTGKKILVLGCNAFGKAFENLPIGKVVDELECSKLLETKKPPRGVWIMGNGEPIMLVNDSGFQEYEIVSALNTTEVLIEIAKLCYFNLKKLKQMQIDELVDIIADVEIDNTSKATFICDCFEVERRGNRQKIVTLLNKHNG